MSDADLDSLLEDLKSPAQEVRQAATQELWRRWFHQKGIIGLELLQKAQIFLEAGEAVEAETILTRAIATLPDFAEAWNRRAVLYYVLKNYRKAIADCQEVLRLNPIHFGALHGLGLCYAALGEYSAAIETFRRALEIQPYAIENQRLLLECTAKLS